MCDELVNIIKVDKPNVCFIGDIHGEFSSLGWLMKYTNFKDTAYFICGDCGFGFNKKEHYSQIFNKLSRTASKLNCEFIFIRGNHDSREYFDKRLINRKCFKTIPDYSVVQTPNHNILCIGGAISVDRSYRLLANEKNANKYAKFHHCSLNEAIKNCQKVYWDCEECVYNEEALNELKLNDINVDIVCTHTGPSFIKPFGKDNINFWLSEDKNLEEDTNNERKTIDNIYNKLKTDGHQLNYWFYGHFHFHNSEYVDNTKFVMLDMYRNGKFDFYDVKNG